MSQSLRPGEERARRVIEHACGERVVQFDDGSQDSMYDLEIHYANGVRAAVEVTADANEAMMALWRLLNDKEDRWIETSLRGGWMVEFAPDARANRIRSELPRFLGDLERMGIRSIEAGRQRVPEDLCELMVELGVVSADRGGTDFPGSIYLTVRLPDDRSGGVVGDGSDATASWIGDFLSHPHQSDVLRKLRNSGLPERHAFVVLADFPNAPFVARAPLMTKGCKLPTQDPLVPDEVTDVWVVCSLVSGIGLRWSERDGWSHFDSNV